jgi:hypothetical protein
MRDTHDQRREPTEKRLFRRVKKQGGAVLYA